ncbi:hypothetical protein Y1Q_0023034 [Alligator mississippiensis]|uniref:Uncharacterized protein n=1 Tax=Alligator mississippiensis TaxID=8496 RepID=A0A151P7I7_ALLMI|nr:hypothetical protein Y1Q_0023034 [Alligator mississippiensis]
MGREGQAGALVPPLPTLAREWGHQRVNGGIAFIEMFRFTTWVIMFISQVPGSGWLGVFIADTNITVFSGGLHNNTKNLSQRLLKWELFTANLREG